MRARSLARARDSSDNRKSKIQNRKSPGGFVAGKALIVWGGWDGHQPRQVAEIFERVLSEEGFAVEVRDTLDAFKDEAKLAALDLIVPVWTMGKIAGDQANPVFKAVRAGVGIAGCHGG